MSLSIPLSIKVFANEKSSSFLQNVQMEVNIREQEIKLFKNVDIIN